MKTNGPSIGLAVKDLFIAASESSCHIFQKKSNDHSDVDILKLWETVCLNYTKKVSGLKDKVKLYV